MKELQKSIPLHVEDFREEHYKLLRRLDGHTVDCEFQGLMSLQLDIKTFIPVLLELGLIRIGTCREALETLKTDSLKEIMKINGIKTGGKKDELINRIISNIDEATIKSANCYHDVYVHTCEGKAVIEASYAKQEEDKKDFMHQAISLIMNGDLSNAYKVICERNIKESTFRGFGIDWNEERKKGVSDDLHKLYKEELQRNAYDICSAIAVFSELSGDSISNVVKLVSKMFPSENQDEKSVQYVSSRLSTQREMMECLAYGEDSVIFNASLDETTCPICGKLDGKRIKITDGKIGKNLPPIHEGCRCTLVGGMTQTELQSTTRRHRNPQTHKSELIPYMTYSQWKKKYMN